MSSISPRYWPDALIPILNGSSFLSSDDFQTCSRELVEFRKRGNSPLSDELADPEKLNACIEAFYAGYREIPQIISVINGANAVYEKHFKKNLVSLDTISTRVDALSQTRFMQEICKFDEASLDEDEKRFLKVCGLPGAMEKTPGGKELTSNKLAKKCTQAYYFAIANSETIKENVKVYRGMSTEQMREVSARRAKASEWYRSYPKEITIDMVVFLRKALDEVSRGRSPEEFVFNDIMRISFHDYIDAARELHLIDAKGLAIGKDGESYRREDAYWASLQSNLQVFIDVAKKKEADLLKAKESSLQPSTA